MMALSLPQVVSNPFPQASRRPSLPTKASSLPTPVVTSSQLANEVIKKLLQFQLVSRMESLTMEDDDYSVHLSPPIHSGNTSLESSIHSGSGRSLYKTEICKRYLMNPNSACEYGARCRFAHGLKELHLTARHPRYKTEHCRAYQLTGSCRYGKRCDFIHNETPYELDLMRTENALYQEYCLRHPKAKHVTLLEVLREFAPSRPEFTGLLSHVEMH
ncbi:zinc finger protein ch type like [Echinococcus multilocularis]|uniref:Zinc finger protein zfs n=1 Tax=Echinococcus multilocularis TaxID=6211 RepID=A0A068XXJ3_ECHMU|nr:zinc finger protein ch type like [Echinococcus multilocularis]